MAILDTILGALLPMVVTFLLGFVASWRRTFGPKDASILNRMVLVYAVPLALFTGTVSASRAELSLDIPLLMAPCVAIVGLYAVVFLLLRFAFRSQVSTSALAALTASAPAVPFMGPAILGYLFGRRTGSFGRQWSCGSSSPLPTAPRRRGGWAIVAFI